MKTYLIQVFKFLLPFIFLGILTVCTYFAYDPFKVVDDYDEFYTSEVGYNEDYIATERYLKKSKRPDSFIFGSSRSGCGFDAQHWSKILPQPNSTFLFASSNETIFGILGKLKLIDASGDSIKNVLLVIDPDKTFVNTTNSRGHLFMKHPLVSGESARTFQWTFLKEYVFSGFFIPYLDYKIFKKERPYMSMYFSSFNKNKNEVYEPFNVQKREDKIAQNSSYFDDDMFFVRKNATSFYGKTINSMGKEMMLEIYALFQKHHTHYKIVISPLYSQVKINAADLAAIHSVFGDAHVYDFTGCNEITTNKYNYYEPNHYRKSVGDSIVQILYK